MVLVLKHREASSVSGSSWEIDPGRNAIIVCHNALEVDIPVCSEHAPRHNAYSLSRKSEDVWQISPARYVRQGHHWIAIAMAFDSEGLFRDFILLTHATARANEELERL